MGRGLSIWELGVLFTGVLQGFTLRIAGYAPSFGWQMGLAFRGSALEFVVSVKIRMLRSHGLWSRIPLL